MTRLFFIILGCVALATPAFAKMVPSQITDDEKGLAYTRKADKILVAVEAQTDIALTFTALPQLSLCGKITNLPAKVDYNNEEVNITFGDFKFIHPIGQEKPDCGPPNKAATAHVLLKRDDLEKYAVKNIRLFYNGWIESYRINLSGPLAVVTIPDKTPFFVKDDRLERAREQSIVPPIPRSPSPLQQEKNDD